MNKPISISEETHYKLFELKYTQKLKTFDDAIQFLIKKYENGEKINEDTNRR